MKRVEGCVFRDPPFIRASVGGTYWRGFYPCEKCRSRTSCCAEKNPDLYAKAVACFASEEDYELYTGRHDASRLVKLEVFEQPKPKKRRR